MINSLIEYWFILCLVLGTLDATVIECLEVMEESLMTSTSLEGVPKESLKDGLDLLKSRFSQKFEPISKKLEVRLNWSSHQWNVRFAHRFLSLF